MCAGVRVQRARARTPAVRCGPLGVFTIFFLLMSTCWGFFVLNSTFIRKKPHCYKEKGPQEQGVLAGPPRHAGPLTAQAATGPTFCGPAGTGMNPRPDRVRELQGRVGGPERCLPAHCPFLTGLPGGRLARDRRSGWRGRRPP